MRQRGLVSFSLNSQSLPSYLISPEILREVAQPMPSISSLYSVWWPGPHMDTAWPQFRHHTSTQELHTGAEKGAFVLGGICQSGRNTFLRRLPMWHHVFLPNQPLTEERGLTLLDRPELCRALLAKGRMVIHLVDGLLHRRTFGSPEPCPRKMHSTLPLCQTRALCALLRCLVQFHTTTTYTH